MAIEQLSGPEQAVVRGCLEAIVSEVFIDATEFEVISGASFDIVQARAVDFPQLDDGPEEVALALHGAMLTLQFYPHRQERRWAEFIPVSLAGLVAVHQRWMTLKGWEVPDSSSPGGYFFDLLR